MEQDRGAWRNFLAAVVAPFAMRRDVGDIERLLEALTPLGCALLGEMGGPRESGAPIEGESLALSAELLGEISRKYPESRPLIDVLRAAGRLGLRAEALDLGDLQSKPEALSSFSEFLSLAYYACFVLTLVAALDGLGDKAELINAILSAAARKARNLEALLRSLPLGELRENF